MKPKFLNDIMVIFSVDVLTIMGMAFWKGEDAQGISTIFQLGSEGIAVVTLFQFFLSAVVIALWRQVFFSDRIFKKMMTLWRTIWMLLAVIVSIAGFIVMCGWFPVDNVAGWLFFLLTFAICFSASMGVMIAKTRLESKKYDNLLKEYQNRREENE